MGFLRKTLNFFKFFKDEEFQIFSQVQYLTGTKINF